MKYYARDGLNLHAEALAQLQASADPFNFDYVEGAATSRGAPGFDRGAAAPDVRWHHPGAARTAGHLQQRGRGLQVPPEAFVELRRYAQVELGVNMEDE